MMITSNAINPVKTAVEKPSRNSGSFAALLNSLSTNFMAYLIDFFDLMKTKGNCQSLRIASSDIGSSIAFLTDPMCFSNFKHIVCHNILHLKNSAL